MRLGEHESDKGEASRDQAFEAHSASRPWIPHGEPRGQGYSGGEAAPVGTLHVASLTASIEEIRRVVGSTFWKTNIYSPMRCFGRSYGLEHQCKRLKMFSATPEFRCRGSGSEWYAKVIFWEPFHKSSVVMGLYSQAHSIVGQSKCFIRTPQQLIQ